MDIFRSCRGTPTKKKQKANKPKKVLDTKLHSRDPNYNMNHSRRGRAIIFNHFTFTNGLEQRNGTHKDVERLEKVLSEIYEFEVIIHHDKTLIEILHILEELRLCEKLTDEDCLLIIVLTHGGPNTLSAKDLTYNTSILWEKFHPNQCSALAQKPKLFLINACRGKNDDDGQIYRVENDVEPQDVFYYKLPLHADFLTMYSSTENFPSKREAKGDYEGSWFIQALCLILEDEKNYQLELHHILRKVVLETCLTCNRYADSVTQCPVINTSLLRDVYFTRKI